MPVPAILGLDVIDGPDDQVIAAADQLVATRAAVQLCRGRTEHGPHLVLAAVPFVAMTFEFLRTGPVLEPVCGPTIVPRHPPRVCGPLNGESTTRNGPVQLAAARGRRLLPSDRGRVTLCRTSSLTELAFRE